MSLHMSRVISVWGISYLLAFSSNASAQWYPASRPAPGSCVCSQPVVQPVYRTVPVTTYQPVRQTVQRPVVETEYEDRVVTEYHPVTEQRTASVPSVNYEYVTEYRTVQRDMGSFQTWQEWRPQVAPWQYDGRPTFFGWMNRTGYALRSAFTPPVRTRRQYVPNVVTEAVPLTRRVARPTTRQVTYNVTRMVPKQTTRKVAVNKVRYVSQEIVTQRPVTVMQTVPVGSRVAYVPYTTSATALAPTQDPISSARAPSNGRSADAGGSGFQRQKTNRVPLPRDNRGDEPDGFDSFDSSRSSADPIRSSYGPDEVIKPADPQVRRSIRAPSIVRLSRRISSSGYRLSGPVLAGSATADYSR